MERKAILDRLFAEVPSLRARYGFASLEIFGSMARGDARDESDLDILVTFPGKATFDDYMGLKLDLEELVGRPVDLLTPRCLDAEMRSAVDREAIRVP